MAKALLFPGQAAQFVGMGNTIIQSSSRAKEMLSLADEVLGYELSKIMLEGPEEKLKETIYTQPAVYVHSMLVYDHHKKDVNVDAVAGHSLGEISACVAAGVFSFEEGLRLVQTRANAMQKACEANPSTMAAILGMEDRDVENVCQEIEGVVTANYNCPGQLVISGTNEGIKKAIETCKAKGARRALEIPLGGAFHSPLMQDAIDDFRTATNSMSMKDAVIPVYQNVDAQPHSSASQIKENLISQIVNPVRWTELIQAMAKSDISTYIEVGGKGNILRGMLRKISRELEVTLWQEE